jgi:hypothetical protein
MGMGMNERIVKLSTEAENYACTVAEKYVPECGEISYLWEHAFRKKFAELIVQDCIAEFETSKRCDPYTGELFKCEYNECLDDQITALKEHFGVEE